MHLRIAAILPILALLAIPARGDLPSFPYKAYVTTDEVYVRSGPGDNYYPTDKLKMGQEVEVYRHDPGGWYAVRPPKGSFSWVSARLLDIGKDRLATVTGDRVAARVGSRFSDIRDVIQVRLDRGEVVDVVQSGQTVGGEQMQPWSKIAPPAGEFRWIFGKYVDPDFPVDGVRKTSGDHSPLVQHRKPRPKAAAIAVSSSSAEAASAAAQVAPPATVGVASHSAPATEPFAPGVQQAAQADRPPASTAMRHISPDEFQAEVGELEMKLSVMVLQDPTAWELRDLSRRAENLLAQANTGVERGRARLLVGKIARLDDIKQRYDVVAVTRSLTDPASPLAAHIPGLAGAATGTERQFDGVGRLTRVVSPKVGAPRYALVNKQGEVNCYLTPAPDVNLRHYEGQTIGVTGISGLMLEPRAKHIAAKHVTLLGDTRLR